MILSPRWASFPTRLSRPAADGSGFLAVMERIELSHFGRKPKSLPLTYITVCPHIEQRFIWLTSEESNPGYSGFGDRSAPMASGQSTLLVYVIHRRMSSGRGSGIRTHSSTGLSRSRLPVATFPYTRGHSFGLQLHLAVALPPSSGGTAASNCLLRCGPRVVLAIMWPCT